MGVLLVWNVPSCLNFFLLVVEQQHFRDNVFHKPNKGGKNVHQLNSNTNEFLEDSLLFSISEMSVLLAWWILRGGS